jgi:protocatechuate 3,4-dioxygenase beta subunit
MLQMMLRCLLATAVCLLVGSAAFAQPPARDFGPAAGSPAGTGTLSGRVVSTEGAPVRRAQVQLFAADANVRKAAVTDDEGRYTFTALPAGRYTIRANKGGYVNAAFGQKGLNQPVPPVILRDGESLTGLTIVLPRGSAITGRVTDEFGDPVLQAQVQAMRFQYSPDGDRRVVPAGAAATTDDLGPFRLYGLMPGDYVISASTRSAIQFTPRSSDQRPRDEPEEGYAPTFYPGTSNAADAQPLSVGLSQELNVQIQLVPSRLSRISGLVVDSRGQPVKPGSPVLLRPAANLGPMLTRPASLNADGMFSFTGIPPGEYVIEVRPRNEGGGGGTIAAEFAFVPLTVGGGDITGLRIATGTGARLSGRVVFDGAPPPAGTRIRVVPQAADPAGGAPLLARQAATDGVVAADGSFHIDGIAGPVFLRITIDGPGGRNAQQGYMTKSVMIDGVDVADVPFDPSRRGAVDGIALVITDKVTEVSGVVSDRRGAPLEAATVMIVPDSLPAGISPARFVRVLQSDANGKFSVRAMPAGRYAALAMTTLEPGRQYDPAVIDHVRQSGKAFSMREGETATLDLRLTSE